MWQCFEQCRCVLLCVSLRHLLRIGFRKEVMAGVVMDVSRFPSLLALAALAGFVVVQMALKFTA